MDILAGVVSGRLHTLRSDLTEITLDVLATDYFDVAKQLRDHEGLRFEQLVDLCGVDNAGYGGNAKPNGRFAVVAHLLSVTNNWRVRLRTYVPDDTCPVVRSLCDVWSSASWYEREAFDLFGIVFEGHPDLRRILTDYDFVGHPLRKDFPVSGFMEMTYDKEQGRVVYQPVSIEPRENTLRVVREDTYGGLCA